MEENADSSAPIDYPQPALPVAQQPVRNVQVIDAGLAEIFEGIACRPNLRRPKTAITKPTTILVWLIRR